MRNKRMMRSERSDDPPVNVAVPRCLHTRLKALADAKGFKLAGVIQAALDSYERNGPAPAPAGR